MLGFGRKLSLFGVFFLALTLWAPFSWGAIIQGDLANPQSYLLSDVNSAGGIQVGDKLFDSFRAAPTPLNTGSVPNLSSILVTPVQIDGNYGLRFNSLWQAALNQFADTTLIFHVTAGDGFLITDDHLNVLNGGAVNGGALLITENLFSADPDLSQTPAFGSLLAYDYGILSQHSDVETFAPIKSVWVSKDIGVTGGGTGLAHISSFTQTFSQTPEPATMSLLVLLGGALLRRRKA